MNANTAIPANETTGQRLHRWMSRERTPSARSHPSSFAVPFPIGGQPLTMQAALTTAALLVSRMKPAR